MRSFRCQCEWLESRLRFHHSNSLEYSLGVHIPAFLLRSGRSWNDISGCVRDCFICKGDEAVENVDVLDSSDYSLQNGRTFVISAHHFARFHVTGPSAKTADQYHSP